MGNLVTYSIILSKITWLTYKLVSRTMITPLALPVRYFLPFEKFPTEFSFFSCKLDDSLYSGGNVCCSYPHSGIPCSSVSCFRNCDIYSNVSTSRISVHKLTKDMRLVVVIVSFSVVAFVFGVYSGIRSGIISEWVYLIDAFHVLFFWLENRVKNFAPLKPFVICWLGFQTAADLSLTGVLSFVLLRSKTGFGKTDSIINRMIRGAVQTGLFASIFALGDLFSFVLHQDTLLYAMFAYPIGRIYTNVSLFASLCNQTLIK